MRLEFQETINSEDEHILFEGISREDSLEKGFDPSKTFGIFLKNHAGETLGGITGCTLHGSLYIDLLFVQKEFQGQGWGSKLLLEAENWGKKRHCFFSTLNTMDFQALPFYQKLGYTVEFVREGYHKNSKMYLLRKNWDGVQRPHSPLSPSAHPSL